MDFSFNGTDFFINNHTFVPPTVPVLLQILSGAQSPQDLMPADSIYALPINSSIEISFPAAANAIAGPHPIHLHGHFFELVTGHGAYAPRKHTVNVPPGGKMTFDLTADAAGDWAFHCHNLYHMTAGMMRVVTVRPLQGDMQNDLAS